MPSTTTLGPITAPPEEQFWQRYSPHHEFPLSSTISVAGHLLILALLAGLGWLIAHRASDQGPLPVYSIAIVPGGSGGNPNGGGPNAGGDAGPLVENTGSRAEPPTTSTQPQRRDPLHPSTDALATPVVPTKDGTRQLVQEGAASVAQTQHMSESLRERLRQSLGKGGSGKDGNRDNGRDKGIGDSVGIGTARERQERNGRWVMVFDTYSGEDYARQLAGLGAYLAVPISSHEYLVLRDLTTRPAHGRVEDLTQIHRMYWEDNKRDSIAPLCQALGIRPVPGHLAAFFPESLERKLLQLELQYRGLRESQIRQTRFKIRKTADGYEPVVLEQIAK